MQQYSDDEFNELGQMIQRCVKPESAWILVVISPHACGEHEHGSAVFPIEVISNVRDSERVVEILEGGADVFKSGRFEHIFARRVENN